MRQLEDFMNRLTDMDGGWWPFVFLRPPKNREISSVILLKMTGFFGPLTGLVGLLTLLFHKGFQAVTLQAVCFFIPFGCLLFYVIYKFTFAYFWNRRARRLNFSAKQN